MIGFPLVVLPWLLGGVRPWVWSGAAACFALSMAMWLWLAPYGSAVRHSRWRDWLVPGVLLLFPFIQVIPLPTSWISGVSPERALWLDKTQVALGISLGSSTLSYQPLNSFIYGCRWLFLAAFAWLLHRTLAEEQDPAWFYSLLFVITGLEAFYGILQALIPSLGVLNARSNNGMASGTFVNRNHYAAFLGMIWPVLLGRLLSLRQATSSPRKHSSNASTLDQPVRQKQVFLAFVTGMVLLALFFSQSRGGIASSLVALSVFVALVGGSQKRGMLPFVVGCWVVMLIYGSAMGFEAILERFNQIEASAPGRFSIWSDTWQMIEDHPWFGVGLGAYPQTIMVYQSHLSDLLEIGHAHSDYLEYTAELGLPIGCALILTGWIHFWRSAWRINHCPGSADRIQSSPSRQGGEQLIRIGAVAGSAAFFAHAWVEFNCQIPANQLVFVMLLVLAHRREKPAPIQRILPIRRSSPSGDLSA